MNSDQRLPSGITFLIIIVASAGAIRLHNLGGSSVWLDEAVSWWQSRGTLSEMIAQNATDTIPPGYNFFAQLSMKALGQSEFALRLPAAVFGILAVVATYLLARHAAGPIAGILAAGLLALSPYAIFYSTDARPYSLLAFTAAMFAWSTAKLIGGQSRAAWAIAAIVSAAGLLYSHPFAALAWPCIAAAGLFCLVQARASRRSMLVYCATQAVGSLLFLPWAAVLFAQAKKVATQGFWLPRPSISNALDTLSNVAGGRELLVFLAACITLSLLSRPRDAATSRSPSVMPIVVAAAFGPSSSRSFFRW